MHVLGVEPLRQPRVVDEIGEHDRDGPPFAVTGLPSTGGAGAGAGGGTTPAPSGVPQPPQNFSPASFANPQAAHATGRLAPHCAQ